MSLRQHLPHTGLVILIILLVVIKQVNIIESLFSIAARHMVFPVSKEHQLRLRCPSLGTFSCN